MPTPHNEAKKGEIAKYVLMPGDPNRAKWIAETFLHDIKLVNQIRGMLCYTGYTKNNVRVTVMPSGMGHPSIGIYSHELYHEYDVDLIIRVGTCGSYKEEVDFFDIIVGETVISDSNYGYQLGYQIGYEPKADANLVDLAKEALNENGYKYHVGKIFAADIFYDFDKNIWKKYAEAGSLVVEMESYALYINAQYAGKKALTLLTATDSFVKEGKVTPEQRQTGLVNMVETAISIVEKYSK